MAFYGTLIVQEQLQERERCIHELEMKMEERDRNLRAIKIDNEAVSWSFNISCFFSLDLLMIVF